MNLRRISISFVVMLVTATCFHSQTKLTSPYPEKVRGYKVERASIEVKRSEKDQSSTDPDVDALIKFGDAQLARITPLGISLEIPIVVSPVTKKGRVDSLLFEDMVFNGTSVEIDEYHRGFDLPNRTPLQLREPLRFYIYLSRAVIAGIDEWINSKETWVVTGRVYVLGKFKKGLLSFKRCVPVELNLTMRNPLRKN